MTLRSRRAGLSLVEVLIAIFIMGIGMLALLTLFPLGALNMQQAIKDDRTGYVSHNAAVSARLMWQEIWSDPMTGTQRSWDQVKQLFPELAAMDDPLDPDGPAGPATGPNPLTPPKESYPLLIDPYGVFAHSTTGNTNARDWLAGAVGQMRIPRRSLNPFFSGGTIPIIRGCSLLDDINFGPGGSALNGGEVQREGRYSWAWLIQRPENQNEGNEVNLVVLAFSGRRLDTATDELSVPATWTAGSTLVTIDTAVLGGGEPPVKKGGWVMDASRVVDPMTGDLHQRAQFYRVIGISQSAPGTTQYELEIQTPSLYPATGDFANPPASPGMAYFIGRFADQDTLAEVFERGVLSINSVPSQ